MKTTIVIFQRDTGRLNALDSGPDYAFARGATMDDSKVMLAFLIQDSDFHSPSGRDSKVQRISRAGVKGFFRNYELTSVPSLK